MSSDDRFPRAAQLPPHFVPLANCELRSLSPTTLRGSLFALSLWLCKFSPKTICASFAQRLEYKCDRTNAAVMQEIASTAEAERIGYHDYGGLLAELGTPPGADASRESLQAAMDADWSISRYGVLPDRMQPYMWSRAGGTNVNFKFRLRYGVDAVTPASVIYDYYNPEAQAVTPPVRFVVR